MEEKKFNYYLNHFMWTARSLELSRLLIGQLQEEKRRDKIALLEAIKHEIFQQCSSEFYLEMKKNISEEVRREMLLAEDLAGVNPVTNLHYLSEVILREITEKQDLSVFTSFIAPGKNYTQSALFLNHFSEDFKKIAKVFGINSYECPNEKAGYCALSFEKPS